MQIPFTADFMYVFRLGIFSSILSSQSISFKRADIIGQKKKTDDHRILQECGITFLTKKVADFSYF